MAIDLDSMSRQELLSLKKNVEKALTGFEKRQKAAALVAAQKAALEHGYSLDEVLGAKSSGPKSAPKYANPSDPSQTWTGRGRQPGWIKAAIAAGTDLSEYAI